MGAIGIDGIGRYTASADGYSIGPVAMGNERERERKGRKEREREEERREKKKGEKEREDKSNMHTHIKCFTCTHTESSIKKHVKQESILMRKSSRMRIMHIITQCIALLLH